VIANSHSPLWNSSSSISLIFDFLILGSFVLGSLYKGGGLGLCIISLHLGICLSAGMGANFLWHTGHSIKSSTKFAGAFNPTVLIPFSSTSTSFLANLMLLIKSLCCLCHSLSSNSFENFIFFFDFKIPEVSCSSPGEIFFVMSKVGRLRVRFSQTSWCLEILSVMNLRPQFLHITRVSSW